MSDKKLAIIESQFMVDYNAPENGVTVGGTQRYAHQLGKLFVQMGYEVIFLTKACRGISFRYEDIGLVQTLTAKYGSRGNREFSKKVYDFAVSSGCAFVCYSDLAIARWNCYPKSFALQHGIAWDGPGRRFVTRLHNRTDLKAVKKISKIVCVDTNFINWARLHDKNYFCDPGKYVYVPNFADCGKFPYVYRRWTKDEPFVLLYPRRMVKHRGFSLFIQVCERLYEEGYPIKPVLAIEKAAREKAIDRLKSCKCEYTIVHPEMHEIAQYYREAFLSYVPTLWSEGTSLSAIESMCSGCPAMVTDVGGLGNIVIPDFNGAILPHDIDAFVAESKRIMNDPDIRNLWAKNCEQLRPSFDIERWGRSIKMIVQEIAEE